MKQNRLTCMVAIVCMLNLFQVEIVRAKTVRYFNPTFHYRISAFPRPECFAEIFPEARVRRNSSSNPLLPPPPSGAVRNFSQNGFALNSEYATIQDKSNFPMRLPRGFAPRHLRVPQSGTRQIPTVQKNPFGLSRSGGGGSGARSAQQINLFPIF